MNKIDLLKSKFERLYPLGGGTEQFTVLEAILKKGATVDDNQANALRTIINDRLGPQSSVSIFEKTEESIRLHIENFSAQKLVELTEEF